LDHASVALPASFDALIVIGTGGTLVELQDDRALSLYPVSTAEAVELVGSTRLGALLGR